MKIGSVVFELIANRQAVGDFVLRISLTLMEKGINNIPWPVTVVHLASYKPLIVFLTPMGTDLVTVNYKGRIC